MCPAVQPTRPELPSPPSSPRRNPQKNGGADASSNNLTEPAQGSVSLASQAAQRDLNITPTNLETRFFMDKLNSYVGSKNITWTFQTSKGDGEIRTNHSLKGTDFGKWVLGEGNFEGKPSLEGVESMCCYELPLCVAFQNGFITKEQLAELYKPDQQRSCKWINDDLCTEKNQLRSLDPIESDHRPKAGDIVLFYDKPGSRDTHVTHYAVAVGNTSGPINVISHHKENGAPVEITLHKLTETDMPHLDPENIHFSTPQWKKAAELSPK